MVLRQGAGMRPKPSDTVRVNYHGTLLDGTVFDSSYERGQPAHIPAVAGHRRLDRRPSR
jgi:FKBP-type peptidyl-prolyl cis-trans isomerase FkpA